jgi:hypothetical protein
MASYWFFEAAMHSDMPSSIWLVSFLSGGGVAGFFLLEPPPGVFWLEDVCIQWVARINLLLS